jgi:hypothetical protein
MQRKPISVWITQAIILVSVLLSGGGFVFYLVVRFPIIMRATNPWFLTVEAGLTLAKVMLIGFLVWSLLLISRRSQWGRWFGLIWLAVVAVSLIYRQLHTGPSYIVFVPSNDAERAGERLGEWLGLLMVVGLLITLMFRFGFSRASRAYFGPKDLTTVFDQRNSVSG